MASAGIFLPRAMARGQWMVLGGQVKGRARLAALSGKKVHTVSDFIAQQDQTNVFVSEIEVEEIKNVKTMLDERWRMLLSYLKPKRCTL